jgi:hypothetical protein
LVWQAPALARRRNVELQRRSESLISAVVLDLTAILRRPELLKIVRNEFLAVEAIACLVETPDSSGGAEDASYEPNMHYDDLRTPQDGWKVAPHHHTGPLFYYLAGC